MLLPQKRDARHGRTAPGFGLPFDMPASSRYTTDTAINHQHKLEIEDKMTQTTTPAITILGLGPGSWHDLTLQARAVLEEAARQQTPVCFRTLVHPTVEPLKASLPDLRISSFDEYYDESDNWEKLYQRITESVCEQAARQPMIYAVPGHPLIGELTVQLLLERARQLGLSTRIVAGLSFLEPVCTALELDPFTLGAQITDANAAIFDAANQFRGCIPGIHEVLRRQGLLAGRWCFDEHEELSPGQSEEISRVRRMYPHLCEADDRLIAENLDRWLR